MVALLILVGAGLRLRAYLSGRGLWLDEAMVALNIISRSFEGLLRPLAGGQFAPIGWLWMAKAATLVLGDGEHGLRMVSLLAALASLPLAWIVARSLLPLSSAVGALALFALNSRLIYYAGEAKQYETDALIALLVVLVLSRPILGASRPGGAGLEPRHMPAAIITGIGAQIASHTAIFLLAGLFSVGTLVEWRRGRIDSVRRWGVLGALWMAAFALLYAAFYRHGATSSYLANYWRDAFAPWPTVPDTFAWYQRAASVFTTDVLGVAPLALGVGSCIAGAAWLGRAGDARLLLLVCPFPFLWLASLMHLYPIHGRFLLFATPALVFLVAGSLAWIGFEGRSPGRRVVFLLAGGALFWHPGKVAVSDARHPPSFGNPKPLISEIARLAAPGDVVITAGFASPPYRYYARQLDMGSLKHIDLGPDRKGQAQALSEQADRLVGRRRVWLLLYETSGSADHFRREADALSAVLAARGTLKDSGRAPWTTLWLFDLSSAQSR